MRRTLNDRHDPNGAEPWAGWWRVAVLGTGYLAIQVVWTLYNAYLPNFYGRYLASNFLIGLIMILDNIAALTVQPYFGALSDRVATRLGRRMPFLYLGVPITALGLALIPRAQGLLPLLLATLLMNVGISIYSSPAVALMPDVTPPGLRARANGIIMLMGGLGALLAIFVLSPAFDRSPVRPFDQAAGVVLASLVLVALAVPERRLARYAGVEPEEGGPRGGTGPGTADEPAQRGRLLVALRAVVRSPDRRAFWLLLAALAWVAAVNGAQNMFTRYGTEALGLSQVEATFMLGYFAGPFILLSIPAGILGDRIGRLRAARAGSVGIVLAFAILALQPPVSLAPFLFAVAGLCWALLMTNSYPILVNLAPAGAVGTYTGLWNLAIALAGLGSPPLYGAAVDLLGWAAFFPVGLAFLVLGTWCVYRVGRGAGVAEAAAG
ncbi:major facilitator superfamily MFS_1 [Thermaerobacter marianensis DSM 12885]|uniref:Major facilitator superfamily MFS_1 n=1 Tax=Thermaerobacter marianensis (strain ATCC 700841 / DSM 12885 / JCM 10246 / 7p75a) TaxID=644966 RepID=E6SHQ9_THEM7|nr:MFS transporter [Thermaerobacter marianensis]ADU50756.1 major facilitator superfamily MFS_1 [Thermaerobacter marianensis DSM 12885]